ncbi:fibrillin-1-like [Pecten maximus]|uniref:fibrillin-1-like n=1 Tax=Pecten maximus TaxID=6579 RepID=UPI001458827D|nr:fibrillin-1-like [Pecten maximus]
MPKRLMEQTTTMRLGAMREFESNVIVSVTSTRVFPLIPASSSGTNAMVTLNVAPDTNTIPILEFGFIAVATDNEDNEDPVKQCGTGFHQLERNNIQFKVVVDFVADSSVNAPGWLMHFIQKNDNDCQNGNIVCSENADCTNIGGSFSCVCKDGFFGDGLTCLDENECQNGNNGCSENADCTNTEGSFSCECKEGFSGDGVTCSFGIGCQQVDE